MDLTGLANTLSPIAQRIAGLAGSHVRLRQFTTTRRVDRPDGSSVPQWADVAGATNLTAVITDVTAERSFRAWGTERQVTTEALLTGLPAGLVVRQDWGLVVLDGPRAGMRFRIVAEPITSDVARTARCALRETTETFDLPGL